MTLTQLIEKAAIGVVIEGHTYHSANIEFDNGAVLFCSHKYRSANSRGSNRGKGTTLEFNYAAPGEKFSKRINKEKAKKLLEG
jgi:hypothetical protein